MFTVIVALLIVFLGFQSYHYKSPINDQILLSISVISIIFWGSAECYAADIPTYRYFFENICFDWTKSGIKLPWSQFESGFVILCCVSKSLIDSFEVLQFTIFSIEIILITTGLKRFLGTRNAIISLCIIFFLAQGTLLGALRQGIAISLFIYALPFIKEQKIIPYFLILFIGSLFHKSAILLSVFYFTPLIYKCLNNRLLLIVVLVISNFIYFSGISVASTISNFIFFQSDSIDTLSVYKEYYSTDEQSNFGIFKIIELNIAYVSFLLIDKENDNYILKCLMLIYIPLQMMIGGFLAHRISYYLIIPYYIGFALGVIDSFRKLIGNITSGYLIFQSYMCILHLTYLSNPFTKNIYNNQLIKYLTGL